MRKILHNGHTGSSIKLADVLALFAQISKIKMFWQELVSVCFKHVGPNALLTIRDELGCTANTVCAASFTNFPIGGHRHSSLVTMQTESPLLIMVSQGRCAGFRKPMQSLFT